MNANIWLLLAFFPSARIHSASPQPILTHPRFCLNLFSRCCLCSYKCTRTNVRKPGSSFKGRSTCLCAAERFTTIPNLISHWSQDRFTPFCENIVRIHADLQGPADTTEFSQTHYYIQGLRTVMFHLQRQKSIERTFSFKHVQHEQTVTHIFYKLVSCFHRTKTINEIRFSAFYVIARSISTCTYTLTSREGKESRETSARQCTIGVF